MKVPCKKCISLAICRSVNKRTCEDLSKKLRKIDNRVASDQEYNKKVKPIYKLLNCYQIVFGGSRRFNDLQFLRGDYIRDDGL